MSALPIIGQMAPINDATFSAPPHALPRKLTGPQRLSLAGLSVGLLMLLVGFFGAAQGPSWIWSAVAVGLVAVSGIGLSVARYAGTTPGIKHNGVMFSPWTSRSGVTFFLAVLVTGFYVLLYWHAEYLEHGIRLFDAMAHALSGKAADQWFVYGFFYTTAVVIMGLRMMLKYRHNRYQIVRTASVMFFQLGLAFVLPQVLKKLNEPEFYFTYFWPLKADYLFPSTLGWLWKTPGALGMFMVAWGIVATFVATPVLTYFFGKRWYCSWVCGCGGLAETAGDPFRQMSDKSLRAWKIERWTIHSVLVSIVVVTAALWLHDSLGGSALGNVASTMKRWYGFLIGAMFSGVIGVGFYPIMGSRVWCRFGCPQAAILGLLQRYVSRFRITTNGGQCISCGNCSTYCEMGIDVRAYAQRGDNIVRASCVGCGVCSAVCPRGVLKLENGKTFSDRFTGANKPIEALKQSLGLAPRP